MLTLKNMFLFAPIKTGYGDGSGTVNERHLAFYRERSQHVGAVTVEPFYLDKGLREIPTQLGIDGNDKVAGVAELTDAIHVAGAKVIAHLNHPGRMANPNIPGNYFVSATDKPCENGGATPKRMDQNDMEQIVHLFA
ncbi:MAG: oxidoreductase, partial [Deltaproteobacteria bacterium]|nr:oxidoreductase [Deltaproteobacteria bacterium]